MIDYSIVTEVASESVSKEQIDRIAHRYIWASSKTRGQDVVELACGSGQGLGLVLKNAKSLRGGDITASLVELAKGHYGNRLFIEVTDAIDTRLPNQSFDVIIFFEAIYYIADIDSLLNEFKRILKPKGKILFSMPNNLLFDFNPSPFSTNYFSPRSLSVALGKHGFNSQFYGYLSVKSVSLRQKILRPIKRLAVACGLIPKTMKGKQFLKRLVFGGLVSMPSELNENHCAFVEPINIIDLDSVPAYKVIYCEALLS
jgi:ubiquinone/menaquinone biosynthesis C-methylase UbiE